MWYIWVGVIAYIVYMFFFGYVVLPEEMCCDDFHDLLSKRILLKLIKPCLLASLIILLSSIFWLPLVVIAAIAMSYAFISGEWL